MARSDVASMAPLLDELFDHAEGNPETPGDIFPGAFSLIVSGQDAFS
jgi:hypothetical protein